MKKSKIITLLLTLSLLISLTVPGTLALQSSVAENTEDNGMKINKTAQANDDGTYTITLEAYATGEKLITEVTEDVPTDIVLVLDQSGSMATQDFPSVSETVYTAYSDTRNSNLYVNRHNSNGSNGNLYYQLTDGSYATVSVVRTQGESIYNYTKCPSEWKNSDYWRQSNNLYVKVEEEYQKVTLSYEWINDGYPWEWYYKYTYQFPDGATIVSDGINTNPGDFDGNGPLYYLSSTTAGEYTYTYTCTDGDGNTINIGTSTGANTNFTDETLYYRTVTNGGDITRLQALKNAVTGFTSAVSQKAAGEDGILGTADDVDHRIAVVGFACSNTGNNNSYNNYQNTEVFIGSTQYKYGTDAAGQYANALQSMKTTQGQNNVTASIGALAADGATYVNHGIEIANGILNANPVPTGEKRNRVVIVFTDGVPGYSGFESTVAESAISQANTSRSLGANVYAVGIFKGADATSAGSENGSDNQKANWFMQNISDNKGTPQTPSYYLSAADSSTLNNIFEQIANQIESGGTTATLDGNTVIKDIISPQFQLPAGATSNDIKLETYNYTADNIWAKNGTAMGATATVDGNKVDVTGFNFSENWCGTVTEDGQTTYRGNKLVISFNVLPKEGFLGGNDVYTNTSAGVYENSDATNPVMEFNRPQVNVPIGVVSVTAEDKNVYLLGSITAEQLKSGTVVMVGGENLDLSKSGDQNKPYGLEKWQTEYVEITVLITDQNGNTITGFENLDNDAEYYVNVIVAPKTDGSDASGDPAISQSGSDNDHVNVYKPELTYEDSEVYYGATITNDNIQLKDVKWKHGETEANSELMGDSPALAFRYLASETEVVNQKVSTKSDIPVDAEVKLNGTIITEYTKFVHNCTVAGCGWNITNPDGSPAFLLHPKTCELTITKTGGADNEPYVFTVKKDGTKYSEITIVGNSSKTIYELPVGTYTIEEDTGWSWRFTPTYGKAVELSSSNTSGTITCANGQNKNYWLNGFSEVVENIFGISKN